MRKDRKISNRFPVQTSVLDRLGEMGLKNVFLSGQIGDGPRHLENAGVAAGGKGQAVGDQLQEPPPLFIQTAETADVAGLHLRVAVQAEFRQPLSLNGAGRLHPGTDRRRGFALGGIGEIAMGDPGHLDLQVDAVEQRAGEAVPITLNFMWRTRA